MTIHICDACTILVVPLKNFVLTTLPAVIKTYSFKSFLDHLFASISSLHCLWAFAPFLLKKPQIVNYTF
jgi:hypothetical protein